MTWQEACEAFKKKRPVYVRYTSTGAVRCEYLSEIGYRRTKDGDVVQFLGGMDKNGNCVYHGTLNMFSLTPPTERG